MNPSLTMLHVRGEGATSIGYGRLGVKLAEGLTARGVDLFNHIDTPGAPNHLQQRKEGTRTGETNVVAWVSTPGHARGWRTGQYAAINTMWESAHLPEAYREHLYAFDCIIVPSQQNVELFSQYHPNVKLALLGVDPAEWFYVKRQTPNAEFRFMCGGSGARKGTDLAVKAFRHVFAGKKIDGPRPVLVMKNPKGEDFYGDGIEMVTGRLSDADEQALYSSVHCYLQPSRGEGFGLQPLQAIAQGIPTILTDAHGHASFAHLGYGLSTTMTKSGYFLYGEAGEWWEPSFDDLCAHIEYVYNNWETAEVRAVESAAVVAREFTWERTADQFIDAIGMDRLCAPYSGDGSWFAPPGKLYPVMVKRRWTADIAGETFLWQPGQIYHEAADVKRIMYEADLLDPACVEATDGSNLSDGLLPSQLENAAAYSGRHSFCDSCGQKLGSGVTAADEILAEMEAQVDA